MSALWFTMARYEPLEAAVASASATAALAASAAAPDATKGYQVAVQREVEAIVTRVKRPALNGSPKPVIRKTKANGLQRPSLSI
jgi:hypothetical protein